LTIAVPRYFRTVERSKETVLRHDLAVVRESIDKVLCRYRQYPDDLPRWSTSITSAAYRGSVHQIAESWLTIASEDTVHGRGALSKSRSHHRPT